MPVKSPHEGYLREAIGSLLVQSSPDWRLLVVAEADERERIARLVPGDSRIEVAVNEGRKLAGAFNTGMRRAGTEYVAILLGDDLWAPEAVEVLARNITTRPEIDFFHSSYRIVDDEGRPVSSVYRSASSVAPEDFLTGAPVKHLMCWRRELGLGIGGMDESLYSVGVDDFDFPWSMAERGATFAPIPECLYVYRDHREGFRITTHVTLKQHTRELARVMRKHGAGEAAVAARLAAAQRSHLRQALYRSRADRWRKVVRGHNPKLGWRQTYT
jgi:glycosyltransferase involved in cell wall biosynthesis